MRIGIDATCLPSAPAGVGRYIHGMVRGLAGHDCDHEYFLFVKAQDAHSFAGLPANFHLVHLPALSRPLRLAWQHLLAGEHARRLRLQVWHGTHYTLPNFMHRLATVVTFHDLGVFHHPHLYAATKRIYFRRAITRALRQAAAVVAVSEATATDLRRLLSQRLIPANGRSHWLSAVPSGVEQKFFTTLVPEAIRQVRCDYGLTQPYVLFVGTLEKRKNLVTLLHAFQRLGARHAQEHQLVLAGQAGNASRELVENIEALGLRERVRWLGYIPEDDLPALYQGADLFVLPSHYEGFGFPLLEAMASGVVALAADNSSLRELAAHPALLCAGPAEVWAGRMAILLAHERLRCELARYGARRARMFSWANTAGCLQAIYEEAAERRARGSRPLVTRSAAVEELPAVTDSCGPAPAALAAAIKRTLAYADMFDYPLTAAEIHYGLIGARAARVQVQSALAALQQRAEICSRDGFHFLPGRDHLPAVRLRRRAYSRTLLSRQRRLLAFVQGLPFVRCVTISGAMAFENCEPGADLDLFLIVESRRLWTVYAILVAVLKILGRRRDLCLNCLLGSESLALAERDFYVAHQIAFLVPTAGARLFREFMRANDWCRTYLPQCDADARLSAATQDADRRQERSRARRWLERFFGGRVWDVLEELIFRLYRRRIHRLTRQLHAQAVVADKGQIKLFTHDHRVEILKRLEVRVQELGAGARQLTPEEQPRHAPLTQA